MQKLWRLTNELTAQLVFNRNATLELKQQLADLQAKTSQAPPLYFGGQYQGSINDQADYRLRIANERLKEENSQLQEQVREYERWMEYIMTKFRLQNFAMAQSRKEAMHEAYKMAEQGGEAAMRLQEENTILQSRLSDLSTVARKAIHEEYYTTESLIESLETENQALREMLGVAEGNGGAVKGRISFHPGTGQFFGDEEDEDEGRARRGGNRVSFPSTGTGSNVASSGSEPDEQQQHQQQPRRTQGFHPLSIQTGLGTPSSSVSSTTSPTSSSWSSSTTASSPTTADRFKSISPPLEDASQGQLEK
ncbi:hypothetical protein BG011_009089 [Mortierella polycephala]|uniref:Uncharacterized protein n=1 Tax=Mortierella polycephala TaxID=41804 RepID=A0A9P6Q8Y5_9FUNG|nr:hypothetical protein BG011_009089 [Mortierella polycephala]